MTSTVPLVPTAFVALLACMPLGTSSAGQAGREIENPVRVAVAPVTLSAGLERQRRDDPTLYADVTTHLGHYLAEALLERGAEVMTAHDSGGVLELLARSTDFHRDASKLTRVAVAQLEVDALLIAEVTRWAPREPGRSPTSGAAIGFRATLHGGPDGHLLWSGEFSERQASFFDHPWRALQYPGRGARWLSAAELARWGTRRLISQVTLPARSP